jgi:hypothetical protein
MENLSMLSSNMDEFERDYFNVESYVKRVAAESIYASTIADHKDKLNRLTQQTAEEIKHNVYKNYGNFMETSKEVGHLEGKMNQMRQSLEEQRKLLQLFKNLNLNNTVVQMLGGGGGGGGGQIANNSGGSPGGGGGLSSSLSLLLEQVEGCSLIAQKSGRNLLYHSDLEALQADDFSVSHKLHAYLLTDSLLLTLPQRKRNRPHNLNPSTTSASSLRKDFSSSSSSNNKQQQVVKDYLYKFHAFYELHDINLINIEDSKDIRNSFQLYKFPECLSFRCANSHIKKEWLENIDNAKKQLQSTDRSRHSNNLSNSVIDEEDEDDLQEEDSDDADSLEEGEKKDKTISKKITNLDLNQVLNEAERSKILRELFSEFDILLAQRDFEKAVEMLLKIKQSNNHSKPPQPAAAAVVNNKDDFEQLIYMQKETELISILRKDLIQSKERGNSKGVVKTGKRVVNSLIKLKIFDEAMDLFIDYHKYLNSETLRRIKLEESNQVYMNNVLNSFFENLKLSFASFLEQFSSQTSLCLSTYLSWCDTEIEILIKKLQSQHYLGRHFDLTMENCQLIFAKCRQFNDFETKFLFETKLSHILEGQIKEQLNILLEASMQRSKLELDENASLSNTEQTRQMHIQNLSKEIESKEQFRHDFSEKDLEQVKKCTLSAIQFTRGALDFFFHCSKVYYQEINFAIVESFVKLFKAELKIYKIFLNKNSPTSKIKKQDIFNNVCLIEKVFCVVERMYAELTGVHAKHFVKLVDAIKNFKDENFVKL